MNVLKKILVALALLLVVAVGAAYLIPAKYHVERSVLIKAKPEALFALVGNLKRWEEWSAWNKELDPTMTREFSGAEMGAGAKMAWKGEKTGEGSMTITSADPKTGIHYSLEFEKGRYTSGGILSFEASGDETKVVWTNEGDAGMNPLARYFGLLMDRLLGPDFQKGLDSLKKAAEAGK